MDCMYHPMVKGSYYEIGAHYGAVLRKHGFKLQAQTEEKLKFGRASEPEVKRIFPEVLEEISGFAQACELQYEHFAAFMFGIGAFKPQPDCSVFATATDSRVLFGRNYDFFYSFKDYTESTLTLPENGYFSIGQSDVFIGKEDGINEKGLAVAMTGVESPIIKPGISFCLAVRCILDKCSTTAEAVRILSEAKLTSANNFLIADKTGELAVVETSPTRSRVRKPEVGQNFVVCTNHFVHPDMQEIENTEERKRSNWDTLPRYAQISNALRSAGEICNLKDVQKILSDHTGYVCSHQHKIKLGTLWSLAASLEQPRILRAEGHPCRAGFKEDLRLQKVLSLRSRIR
jgi:predicted choloylglycine hydrolase